MTGDVMCVSFVNQHESETSCHCPTVHSHAPPLRTSNVIRGVIVVDTTNQSNNNSVTARFDTMSFMCSDACICVCISVVLLMQNPKQTGVYAQCCCCSLLLSHRHIYVCVRLICESRMCLCFSDTFLTPVLARMHL
jgi:hypothetical protein